MTRSPVICTVPRGGGSHLITLPYESTNQSDGSYVVKLHTLKRILRKDPATIRGFRLSESSAVTLSSGDLISLVPKRSYTPYFLAAMLEILTTPKNLFIAEGFEETWKGLSKDTEHIWFAQFHGPRWTALRMYLDGRKPGRKVLRFTLFDPEDVFASEPATLAVSQAMSELRGHAKWPDMTQWHKVQGGKIDQVVCTSIAAPGQV